MKRFCPYLGVLVRLGCCHGCCQPLGMYVNVSMLHQRAPGGLAWDVRWLVA